MVVRFFSLGVVVLSTLVVLSCGLPSISFLAPPEALSPSGSNEENYILRFRHDGDNDGDDFRGYELYYKLYYPDDSAISSDESSIEATPRDVGPGRLEARGFIRVAPTRLSVNGGSFSTVTDDSAPLLPLAPTGSGVEFRIDLRSPDARGLSDEDTHMLVSWDDGGNSNLLEMRRRSTADAAVGDPLNDYEGFWDSSEYVSGDFDVGEMLSLPLPSPIGNLTIVCYVLTYGIDASNFNPYYSEPVRLEPATLVTG